MRYPLQRDGLLKSNWIPITLTVLMGVLVSYILIIGKQPTRWYSQAQVQTGKLLFENNCASCHGLMAQGLVANWKQRDAKGDLPPPPLNGSAHAWHHAMPLLLEIVQQGGSLYDGTMPAFAHVLNPAEQLATIAYFQHYWDDEIYHLWQSDRQNPALLLGNIPAVQTKQSSSNPCEVQAHADSS